MTFKIPILAIAGMLVLSSAAVAQTAKPAPTPQSAMVTVSDEDVRKFAVAAVALNNVQDDTSVTAADKPSKMVAAVQQSGLDPQKFSAIAEAAQNDPALQKKIQVAASEIQPGQPPQKQK